MSGFHMINFELDAHGFLKQFDAWCDDFVMQIATAENLTLTQDHWIIIHFFRDFYQQYQLTPSLRVLIKYLRSKWPEEKATSFYIQTLFPQGVMLQASRLAGLPKPARCL